MPWTVKDVDSHKKDLTPRQKRTWVRVANEALALCVKEGRSQAACEASAIRQANTVAVRMQSQQHLQELTVHLAGSRVRYEVLDGQRYAVATVVPIREGVLNQFYVPAAEIAAFVHSWDGLAVPLNHPKNSYGEYVSVNSPTQLEQSIGRFFSAHWDGERLTGEIWLNVDKCTRLGGEALDVLQRIEAGEPMECSTAFWAETDSTPGMWNGIAYLGTHRHLRPDHLAILPNAIGACSLEHGCGLRALHCACDGPCACEKGDALMELEGEMKHPGKLRQALRTLFAFANGPDPDEHDPATDEQEEAGDGDEEKEGEGQEQGVLTTHLTHDDIKLALYAELGKALERDNAPYYGLDVCDIEESSVIYRDGAQFYRRVYTIGDNNAVTLSGTPEEVQRDTRYIPIAAAAEEGVTTNTTQRPRGDIVTTYEQKGDVMLTKPELIARLIAHERTGWTEDQTPVLQTMEERILEHMLAEAQRRDEQDPLTLDALKTFLKKELDARDEGFDRKLATYSQRAEEKAERERLEQVLVTHGWPEEEAQALSIQALRRMHQTLDPVSYVSNGLPRMHVQSDEDTYPADEPNWG